jgi:hypothetical protein
MRLPVLTFGIAALALVAGGSAGTSPADPSFAPGPPLPVGTTPVAGAVGDFDGNGSADLAVANSGYRNNLRILLNDGSGRFRLAPGSPFKVGRFPSSIAKADFDGDGKPDLAVASENVRILLGDGSGRFAATAPVELGAVPLTLTAADLTGDAHPDLVAVTYSEGGETLAISVLLNDGTGRLAAGPSLSVIGKGDSLNVAVADFTGDGKQDLVVAGSNKNKLVLLPGNGAGGFGQATLLAVGGAPGALVTGDLNGDDKPDLAVFVGKRLAILLGNGAGGFAPATGSPLRVARSSVLSLAELNGDTRPDLAAVDPDNGTLAVLLGLGGGRFRPAALSPFFARWPSALVSADFDGDGKTDLLPLSDGTSWGPYPAGNWLLRQTASSPAVLPGHSLPADALFSTRSPILDLAADANQVALCSAGIVVWAAPGRKARTIKSADCAGELAVGGGRVAWIEYYFGNTHRDYGVFVARISGGKPRQVDGDYEVETDNPDDPSGIWLGQLVGGGPLLAYNGWSVWCVPPPCDEECYGEGGGGCDSYNPTLRVSGQWLARISTRRAPVVRGGASAYPLRAVGGGRMAVEPGGDVVVLSANGARVSRVPANRDDPARSVELSKTRLALLHSSTLDLYNPANGAKQKSIPLGPAAGLDLAGVNSRLALLRGQGHLVLVRLADGKLVSLPLGAAATNGFVDARLTTAGLFYAYNLTRGKTRGRVVFEPTAKLLRRF